MKKLFILILSLYSLNLHANEIKKEVIEKTRKSVVSIDARISVSPYGSTGNWKGTGFVCDKKLGLVITNAHVTAYGSAVGKYFLTFENGQQLEGKLLYFDLWLDCAVLKVDPLKIPKSVEELAFSKNPAILNEKVFIVGNNEAKDFSFHDGYVSNIYAINGLMPSHSYVVNLNTRGGSSGSPLLNEKGEVLGLHYGGSDTYALTLKGEYLKYILNSIKSNKPAIRQHIGVICDLYSLDKAVKHRYFPEDVMLQYLKDFPKTKNEILVVKSILKGSPADGILKAGDIIWEVNDKPLGASLYDFDNIMNSSKNSIKLVIWREGTKLETVVNLYDINKSKINEIVEFGGAYFFKADDIIAHKTGVKIGSIFITDIKEGSSFSVIKESLEYHGKVRYALNLFKIDNNEISDLSNLIKVIPSVIKKEFVSCEYINYKPYFGFAGVLNANHEHLINDITFNSTDPNPRHLIFDQKKMEWQIKTIE